MTKRTATHLDESKEVGKRGFSFTGTCFCCGQPTNIRKRRDKRPNWETVVVSGDVEKPSGEVVTFDQPTRIEVAHTCAKRWRNNGTFKRSAGGPKPDFRKDQMTRRLLEVGIDGASICRAIGTTPRRVAKIRKLMK